MKKYVAEAIATFALVFCGTGAVTIDEVTKGAVTHVGVAVTFGLVIMVMIYAVGDVSGAHMNPAVTIAFASNKNLAWKEVGPYIISQAAGAFAASYTLKYLFPDSVYLGTTIPSGPAMQSFVLEIILTFFLMLVILQVATGSKEKGLFAGIAIGGTILMDAMFGGPISGASMNPMRSLAPAIASLHTEYLWVYLIAPVVGALLAVVAHRVLKK